MIAYLIRRLLWMIPVLLVILMINFGVPRLRDASFAEAMQAGEQGEQSADVSEANAEHYLAQWRNTGRALPAIINMRVWYDTNAVAKLLR